MVLVGDLLVSSSLVRLDVSGLSLTTRLDYCVDCFRISCTFFLNDPAILFIMFFPLIIEFLRSLLVDFFFSSSFLSTKNFSNAFGVVFSFLKVPSRFGIILPTSDYLPVNLGFFKLDFGEGSIFILGFMLSAP